VSRAGSGKKNYLRKHCLGGSELLTAVTVKVIVYGM